MIETPSLREIVAGNRIRVFMPEITFVPTGMIACGRPSTPSASFSRPGTLNTMLVPVLKLTIEETIAAVNLRRLVRYPIHHDEWFQGTCPPPSGLVN